MNVVRITCTQYNCTYLLTYFNILCYGFLDDSLVLTSQPAYDAMSLNAIQY